MSLLNTVSQATDFVATNTKPARKRGKAPKQFELLQMASSSGGFDTKKAARDALKAGGFISTDEVVEDLLGAAVHIDTVNQEMTSNNTPPCPQVPCGSNEVEGVTFSTSDERPGAGGTAGASPHQTSGGPELVATITADAHATPPAASRPGAARPSVRLPTVALEYHGVGEDIRTRGGTIEAKRIQERLRQLSAKELRQTRSAEEKSPLYWEIRAHADEAAALEDQLRTTFIPLHTPDQFLGPRIFFVSALFRVRRTKEMRQQRIELQLPVPHGTHEIRYAGPELRQSDGLVFLALLHMLRDVRAGIAVSLQPEAVCRSLFGRYDGNARRQLREHIQRLQQGLLVFKTFSVQLCQTFAYPKTGPWTVALDGTSSSFFRYLLRSGSHCTSACHSLRAWPHGFTPLSPARPD